MTRFIRTLGVGSLMVTANVSGADLVGLVPEATAEPARSGSGIDAEISKNSTNPPWRTREELFGDMGGFRSMLARHGMSFVLQSLDESFANPNGALATTEDSRYAGLTDVIFAIDTEGAGWWKGGFFFVDLQNSRDRRPGPVGKRPSPVVVLRPGRLGRGRSFSRRLVLWRGVDVFRPVRVSPRTMSWASAWPTPRLVSSNDRTATPTPRPSSSSSTGFP